MKNSSIAFIATLVLGLFSSNGDEALSHEAIRPRRAHEKDTLLANEIDKSLIQILESLRHNAPP